MPLEIIKGDIFKAIPQNNQKRILIPHCCNNVPGGAWGSGFVLAINKFSPKPRQEYIKWAQGWEEADALTNNKAKLPADDTTFSDFGYKYELGRVQVVKCQNNVSIANMIGQHETIRTNSVPVRYWALAKAMRYLGANKNTYDEFWTVRFGSGLAGGNQNFIQTLIEEIWVNEGIPVKIFEI